MPKKIYGVTQDAKRAIERRERKVQLIDIKIRNFQTKLNQLVKMREKLLFGDDYVLIKFADSRAGGIISQQRKAGNATPLWHYQDGSERVMTVAKWSSVPLEYRPYAWPSSGSQTDAAIYQINSIVANELTKDLPMYAYENKAGETVYCTEEALKSDPELRSIARPMTRDNSKKKAEAVAEAGGWA